MLRRCLRPLIPQLLTLIRPCLQADNVLDKSKRTQCPLPLPGCKKEYRAKPSSILSSATGSVAPISVKRGIILCETAATSSISAASAAFCKRSALRRVSVTKLSP